MSALKNYNTQRPPTSKSPQGLKTLKFKDTFNPSREDQNKLIKISSSNNDLEPQQIIGGLFSYTFNASLAKNSLAKNSLVRNSIEKKSTEKLTSRQSKLNSKMNQLSQKSSCKEMQTCLRQERYDYMKKKVIYQPRNIEYVLAPNQKPIKYRYGGFHKTMKSFHKESYRNAIKKHKIAQNPPKYQAISRSNTTTLQATLDPNNFKKQQVINLQFKTQKQGKSGSPKAHMLKEQGPQKYSAQQKSGASSIAFEGIQGRSLNINPNFIQGGLGQDFKTLLSTKSHPIPEFLMQTNAQNNLQLQHITNMIMSEDETEQVTPLIRTTGGHTADDKSAESQNNSKLFPKLISPVEIIQEGIVTDDVSMKNFNDELNQKPIQVLLTNNNSTANQKVYSLAQSGNQNTHITDQEKHLIINMGEDLESMNSKFSHSKSGSISKKNSPNSKKQHQNKIRFENIRQSSKFQHETESKISQKSPDNIVVLKSDKKDGPSTRLSNFRNNPITQSNEDPAKLLNNGQSVLDDTFRSISFQKMIARDIDNEEEGVTIQKIDLLAGEGTKEIEAEIRDNQVASLNDFNNRLGTSVTDNSRSLNSRKVSGIGEKSKQSFQQQTMSRGDLSKLLNKDPHLSDPHLKVNIDLNQNNGISKSLQRNRSSKRNWNFLQPNIQNLNFDDVTSPIQQKTKRPKTGNFRTSQDPKQSLQALPNDLLQSANYKCFPQKSPASNSSPNMKRPFVPTNAHGKSFMQVENFEEVPKNYLSDMMVQSNSIYHAQVYQREKAELLLKQQRFQKQAEDALKQLCKSTGTDMYSFNRNVNNDKPIDGGLGGTLEGSLSPASGNDRSSKIKSDMALLMDQAGWDAQVLTLLEQNQDQQIISNIDQYKEQFGTLNMMDTNRVSEGTQQLSQRNQLPQSIPSPLNHDIDLSGNHQKIFISNDSQQQLTPNQQRKNALMKSGGFQNASLTQMSNSNQNQITQSPNGNFFGSSNRQQNVQDTQYRKFEDKNSTDDCNETKEGLDVYQQNTSGDNFNLAPKLLQDLDSRLNVTQQSKAKGTKTQQERYESVGHLPQRKSYQSNLSRPFSKRSNAQFSNTNLSEIERQFHVTRRNVPCLAIRPQQIKIPKQIGQSVKNLDNQQKKRALISHRDVIDSIQFNPSKYLQTHQKSETHRSSIQNQTAKINPNSNGSISQTRKQTEDPKSQITMVENNFLTNDGSMVNIIATQRTARPPLTARPYTAKEDRQQFQKQRLMTARQKVMDSRYKQRQALFQNKHNTQHNAQVLLAQTNKTFQTMTQKPTSKSKTTLQSGNFNNQNMQKQISMKQLKESISQNFLKHIPQSPLKYFNQENNSQIDDAIRRSNAQFGQRGFGQKTKLLFNQVDDEHRNDMNYFSQVQSQRRSSARVNNKDMDVIIPNDGMASAMRKLGTLKADTNVSHSRGDQQRIFIIQNKTQQNNGGPTGFQSSQFLAESDERKFESKQENKGMPEQSIYLKTGNRQFEQDFKDLNQTLNQKTMIQRVSSNHAIQPIIEQYNKGSSGQRSGNSYEGVDSNFVEDQVVHLSPNLQKAHQKNIHSHTQMSSGEGHLVVEEGVDQVKIMSAGRKRVAMSKLGNSSHQVSNGNIKVSASFQNPVDGENKFSQLKDNQLVVSDQKGYKTQEKLQLPRTKSFTRVNMVIDSQLKNDNVFGQQNLREKGKQGSGPATLVHEIESPDVVQTTEESPLKINYNPAF